jgi:hypothetical protein
MTLTQIARKYNISEAFLNAKDDALVVAATSIQDIIREMQSKNGDPSVINKLQHTAEFLREVKNSSIG